MTIVKEMNKFKAVNNFTGVQDLNVKFSDTLF